MKNKNVNFKMVMVVYLLGIFMLQYYDMDGKTQEMLLGELHYDKSVLARTVHSLEEKGYLIRKKNPSDKRSDFFYLTDKGKDFKPVMMNALKKWSKKAFDGIDESEMNAFKGTLEKIVVNGKQ